MYFVSLSILLFLEFCLRITDSATKMLMSTLFRLQLLDMVERNELNRSLLALLDENIVNAQRGDQVMPRTFKVHFLVILISGLQNKVKRGGALLP